jgi:hypothetical protein
MGGLSHGTVSEANDRRIISPAARDARDGL